MHLLETELATPPTSAIFHQELVRKGILCDGAAHLPERIKGLVNTRRPAMRESFMLFLQAVNLMRKYLPRLGTVVGALRELLKTLLAGTIRTKRVARNKATMRRCMSRV